MNESLHQLEAVQLGVLVSIVHPEVVEHQLLAGHILHVSRYLHVLLEVLLLRVDVFVEDVVAIVLVVMLGVVMVRLVMVL